MGRCGRGPGTSLARALLSVISKTGILSSRLLCPASYFVLAPILSCCSLCPGDQSALVINLPWCLGDHFALVSGCSVLLKTIVSWCLLFILFPLSWCYCCPCDYHVLILLFSLSSLLLGALVVMVLLLLLFFCCSGALVVMVEVSLLYTKYGVGDNRSVNVIYSLILVSDHEILCSQEKVLVLIMDLELVCVLGRWI